MISNYKNTELKLYGYLAQIKEFFKTNNVGQDEVKNIENMMKLIESRKFNVAVMGEFKRGKSSLINAMLGTKILPADITPATATINRITYGAEPSLTVLYKDGAAENADLQNISDYVTMLTEVGIKRASQIREAIVQYPSVICQNNVDIIDTPGLSDNVDMTRITMERLTEIDAAIVVVSALSPFSDKETEFVCQLVYSDNIENIVFVVTFIDQIDEDEQDKLIEYIHNRIIKNVYDRLTKQNTPDEVLVKARRMLDQSLIFGVSSIFALKSFITGDRALLKKSRFEAFKTDLYEFLTSEQGTNTIIKAIKAVRQADKEFDRQVKEKSSRLEEELTLIYEQMESIMDYCKKYRENCEAIFKNCEKPVKEILEKALSFKSTFLNFFSNALEKVQINTQKELAGVVSSISMDCWREANEAFAKETKTKILDMFTISLNNFTQLRNNRLLASIYELQKLGYIEWGLNDSFDEITPERILLPGFPSFKWQAPLISSYQQLNNNIILRSIKNAVDLSVQKMHEDLAVYIGKLKSFWLRELQREITAVTAVAGSTIKEIEENKKDELSLLKINYNQQKLLLQDINTQIDEILSVMFKSQD